MFLPTAAAGNSLALATFGGAGEIMAFFYPHLDFASNVREGMLAVYIHDPSGPHLLWCFADAFERTQTFDGDSSILVTTLRHRHYDLTVETTDLLPPDEYALVRRIAIRRGDGAPPVSVMHYFNLSLGDVDRRNAIHFLPQDETFVQQFRDINLALTCSCPFTLQAGAVQRGGVSGTKQAMESGHLHGNDQCMGDVDFAVAMDTGPGLEWSGHLVLAGARVREQASADAVRLAKVPFEVHQQRTAERCRSILSQATACRLPEFDRPYRRAVLVLHDLFDKATGTFIAAPEFDAYYQYSGGYGYCWPRDAAVSAMTAARLGFPEMAEAFFDWCAQTQLDDGHWFQRYWTNHVEAPSWCVREHEIQLDQTCAVLHAAGLFADMLGDRRSAFVDRFSEPARRAANAIIRHVDDGGLHLQSADLWECCWGSFAYTQAAVIAALREGGRVFGTATLDLDKLRRVLFERFWSQEAACWARRVEPDGRIDRTLDSSCLGLIEPWQVLDPARPDDHRVAEQTLETLNNRLAVEVRGGQAILRFEHEDYMGGGPGCVNTLWAAQCHLRLAATASAEGRGQHVEVARKLIGVALANTNPNGQLPELIPNLEQFPYWAAPHGWASSLLIESVLTLQSLEQD